VELVHVWKLSLLARSKVDRFFHRDDAYIIEKECATGILRMRLPRRGFDAVRPRVRVVVVPILDIAFRIDAYPGELAGLARAMSRGDNHLRSDEGAGAAPGRYSLLVHHNEHRRRMCVAVEGAVSDKRRSAWCEKTCRSFLAAEREQARSCKGGDELSRTH